MTLGEDEFFEAIAELLAIKDAAKQAEEAAEAEDREKLAAGEGRRQGTHGNPRSTRWVSAPMVIARRATAARRSVAHRRQQTTPPTGTRHPGGQCMTCRRRRASSLDTLMSSPASDMLRARGGGECGEGSRGGGRHVDE